MFVEQFCRRRQHGWFARAKVDRLTKLMDTFQFCLLNIVAQIIVPNSKPSLSQVFFPSLTNILWKLIQLGYFGQFFKHSWKAQRIEHNSCRDFWGIITKSFCGWSTSKFKYRLAENTLLVCWWEICWVNWQWQVFKIYQNKLIMSLFSLSSNYKECQSKLFSHIPSLPAENVHPINPSLSLSDCGMRSSIHFCYYNSNFHYSSCWLSEKN